MQVYQLHNHSGGVRDCGRFFLDFVGQLDRDAIEVAWESSGRKRHADVDRIIEETWRRQTREAAAADRRLFNGKLCRLNDCALNDQLKLRLGPADFKSFMGTNLMHANLRYTYGPDVLADVLGVSAALQTSDGFLVLGKRSRQVFYHADRIHPIGGVLEIPEDGDEPHPFEAMVREIEQECGIAAETLREVVCVGLVRDKHIVQPELIFDVRVDEEFARIAEGSKTAPDGMEHVELIPIRNHPSSVIRFVETRTEELTAIALAVLLLHGLRNWGTGWFASARGYLRSMY